ncbi:MAG: prepilin-type N-terminal cleavage/methylation domain-containing protein [Nitrospirae bacterium]|uniref:type II secretion system protein n=1 Tax=Candidatus Magnetobacterium casense TaxID=1455061 RepID=UPI00138E4BDA|nr:prepilin-type N-terminal cleavage/methylation domain-containing protein [Candidatus Magnetobacterium casensis]MBF0338702.1 prepilin-type N-terminal cleavage/methylation domain-containing protein [Nitrospirota bacterium]
MKDNKGFSLLELLVVIAIISLILSIAVAAFLGIRDRSRMTVFLRAAKEARGDLQSWLDSAYSPSGKITTTTSVDCQDVNAGELLKDGVATKYAYCRNSVLREESPWKQGTPLWVVVTDVAGISAYTGQIVMVQKQTTSTTWATSVSVYAIGLDGATLYNDTAKY